jgi:hypothetical protein
VARWAQQIVLARPSKSSAGWLPRGEQVYGDGWTVADLADPGGYDFADRLASAKWVSPQWGDSRHRALARGTLDGRPRNALLLRRAACWFCSTDTRSSGRRSRGLLQPSRKSPRVLDSGWAAAASEIHRGQVVSHVLAAVVAFALTVTRAVRRLRESQIGLSSQRKQTPKWKSTSRPGTAPVAPVAEGRLRLRARSEASPFGAFTHWTRYGGLSAQHRRGSSLR